MVQHNEFISHTSNTLRKIIHIDMDAFFVSVEIRDNPELANKPVAVGGSSRRRGVLSTCNYIARQYGIRSAMATHTALQKCPDLVLVPGRMAVYQEVSQHIREIMLRYCDVIEPLSLDEAYLEVTHSDLFQGSATLIAQDIRQTIARELGLTASAGIAPLKFLAKIASDMNKPNGQYVIEPTSVDAFIAQMPLSKIPGVGKVTFQKLNRYGLYTGKDIKGLSAQSLQSKFGKFGCVLWQRCHGIDEREIAPKRIRKSVGVERTFADDIYKITELQQYLADNLWPELQARADKYLAQRRVKNLAIKVKFSDFQLTTKACQSDHLSLPLLQQLLVDAIARGGGKSVRLLGAQIGLSESDDQPVQFSLALDK